MNMKEFKEKILSQLSKSDNKSSQSIDTMIGELGKATEEEVRQLLNEIPIHDDLFMGDTRHTLPSTETIRVGPSQQASGGGAEKMIREYSNVAPQYGITLLYNEFSRKLDTLRKSILTISEAVKAQSAVISHIVKSDEAATQSASSSFSDEVTKAKEIIKKSKSLILKSELYGIESNSTEDAMEDIRKAEVLLKKAKSLLIKAEDEEEKEEKEEKEIEKSLIDVKKFSLRLDKAKSEIMDIVKAEEEKEKKKKEDEEKEAKAKKAEEEEKEEKAKKAEEEKEREAKAKAKGNDKGNQDDGADKEGMQKDAASKSEDITSLVKKTVSEFIDTISNTSTSRGIPDLTKAQKESFLVAKSAQIDEAFENGLLSSGEEMTARSILNMLDLAQKGDISPSIVKDRIYASSSAVQSVFNGN